MVVGPEILFRQGQQSDLKDIVRLLSDDPFTGDSELEQDVATGVPPPYEQAWHEIDASEDNEILVAIRCRASDRRTPTDLYSLTHAPGKSAGSD